MAKSKLKINYYNIINDSYNLYEYSKHEIASFCMNILKLELHYLYDICVITSTHNLKVVFSLL